MLFPFKHGINTRNILHEHVSESLPAPVNFFNAYAKQNETIWTHEIYKSFEVNVVIIGPDSFGFPQ